MKQKKGQAIRDGRTVVLDSEVIGILDEQTVPNNTSKNDLIRRYMGLPPRVKGKPGRPRKRNKKD